MADAARVEELLERTRNGDAGARAELFSAVYAELRGVAQNVFERAGERPTLQATALVHEAFVKLAGVDGTWESRKHFVCVAANAMRQVLADTLRAKHAERRPDPRRRVTLNDELDGAPAGFDFEELHVALERLAEVDPRGAQVVELRVFGGMSVEEVADVLELSERSVHRDWRAARAWLREELDD